MLQRRSGLSHLSTVLLTCGLVLMAAMSMLPPSRLELFGGLLVYGGTDPDSGYPAPIFRGPFEVAVFLASCAWLTLGSHVSLYRCQPTPLRGFLACSFLLTRDFALRAASIYVFRRVVHVDHCCALRGVRFGGKHGRCGRRWYSRFQLRCISFAHAPHPITHPSEDIRWMQRIYVCACDDNDGSRARLTPPRCLHGSQRRCAGPLSEDAYASRITFLAARPTP